MYPTLTYLEEVGYVTAPTGRQQEAATITAETGTGAPGREPRFRLDALDRLAAVGHKVTRMRHRLGRDRGDDEDDRSVPQLVRAARDSLRDVAAKRLEADEERRSKDRRKVLARAAMPS